jgi:ParB/RepB/Spo0J family partition protein
MSNVQHINISLLHERENQHREHFDREAILALTKSMLAAGFLTQLDVRPASSCEARDLPEGHYEVTCGHRRLRAAREAGLTEIPCVVQHLNDRQALELELLDNLNAEKPLPWEEGAGYAALVEQLGLSEADVAGRAGKSSQLVRDRILIYRACGGRFGEDMRRAFHNQTVSIYALTRLAALPSEDMAPKRCPGCEAVCREDAEVCPACGQDLREVIAWTAGAPQRAALGLLLKGIARDNKGVDEVVTQVESTYGLGRQVLQTSLGFGDLQVSEAAVEVRTGLERVLDRIAAASDFLLRTENLREIEKYTPGQRESIRQQVAAAEAVFRRVREAVTD